MSRGLRNCNPGNIRHSRSKFVGEVRPSQDSAFKQFESMAYGYRAMFVLLDSYRRRYGLSNIRAMITRWAPPVENHTEAYIRLVAERSGIDAEATLDTQQEQDMIPVVAAMSEVENGKKALREDVEEGWRLFVCK
ncbi:MAG: structural protein P5 [Alistipes sp.]|nr:structural protein P5 [Alistipes sp.]